MNNRKITVIYICHDNGNGGSAQSLRNLIASVLEHVEAIVLMRKEGTLKSQLEELGAKVVIVPFELNIAKKNKLFRVITYPLRMLRDYYVNTHCINRISRLLHGKTVDIIHSNSSVISFGSQMAKRLHSKHVWHIRELMDVGLHMRPIEGFAKFNKELLASDALIAITKPIYSHWNMQQHKNAYVIPDAVRSVNEAMSQSVKGKYVLFCAATLSDSKGADQAAIIFCKSHLYDNGYKLYYIGNYTVEYRTKLEKIASSFKQDDALCFLGYQKDIKKYMVKASVFLMCSKFEGLGRVTIEAMFYGCPVLGYNSGGTKEIIVDGSNGLLYNNNEEAVDKLRLLIEDKSLSDKLIITAIEDAKKLYSEETYGKTIITLYHNLLKD